MHFLGLLAMCACAASVVADPAQSQQANEAARVSPVFADRVQAYVTLQKRLENSLSALESTAESSRIAGHQDELAAKVADARRGSRPGDIFAADVAEQFRTIILDAFRGPDAEHVRRTIQEGDPVQPRMLRVNDVYPEELPVTTMPPTLLRRLPPLPMELAYRIIGRALVLQDIKTNLIVDFIPDAIPRVR